MLRRLTVRTAPATAVHGTMHTNYQSILQKGLLRGTRRHLHFANGDEAERARVQDKELSGFKSSSDLLLTFDIRACLNEGTKFYEAPNGVLLSPGRQGRIESRFIISVKVARTGKVVAAQGDHMLPSAGDVQWLFASAVGERPPRHSRKRILRPCAFSETRIVCTACDHSLSHLRESRIMRGNARFLAIDNHSLLPRWTMASHGRQVIQFSVQRVRMGRGDVIMIHTGRRGR